jgi:hypothetical protein
MCNRKFPGVKDGRCVRLTTLPLSCAYCLEIWKPQPPGIVRACPGLWWDCFNFTSYYVIQFQHIFLRKSTNRLLTFCLDYTPINCVGEVAARSRRSPSRSSSKSSVSLEMRNWSHKTSLYISDKPSVRTNVYLPNQTIDYDIVTKFIDNL